MLNSPLSPWPSYSEDEIEAVSKVLRSGKVNYWTGDECRQFEVEFAAYAQTKHAIAVANGTVALDLALHGLGIGAANGGSSTDEVIVSPRSFMASVSCVLNAGAKPVFADIGADSQNLEAFPITAQLSQNTKAVICVHLAGWPCDIDAIRGALGDSGVAIIEDCAQAHGALYRGQPVGSLGDVAAWSFCQDKIMTTGGEGGMVTCNDPALWDRMWSFKDHGKSWEAVYERKHPPGFRWQHESIGTNWRMTEMQGVLGRIQLKRLSDWTSKRTQNASKIAEAIAPFSGNGGPVRVPRLRCAGCSTCDEKTGCRHAWYRFYAFVRPENLAEGWTREKIVSEISQRGVPCMQGSCPEIYLEKAFDGLGIRPEERLPVAQELGETSIAFLVHPTLTPDDIFKTCQVIEAVFTEASR